MDAVPTLVPGPPADDFFKNRKALKTQTRPIAVLPGNKTVAVEKRTRKPGITCETEQHDSTIHDGEAGLSSQYADIGDAANDIGDTTIHITGRSRHQQRKSKQWLRWDTDVIPSLVDPYMELMRVSDSLRCPVSRKPQDSTCGCLWKSTLEVVCVMFTCTLYSVTPLFIANRSHSSGENLPHDLHMHTRPPSITSNEAFRQFAVSSDAGY